MRAGVTVVVLLALSDSGAPAYDTSTLRRWLRWECQPLRVRRPFPRPAGVAQQSDISQWAATVASAAAASQPGYGDRQPFRP